MINFIFINDKKPNNKYEKVLKKIKIELMVAQEFKNYKLSFYMKFYTHWATILIVDEINGISCEEIAFDLSISYNDLVKRIIKHWNVRHEVYEKRMEAIKARSRERKRLIISYKLNIKKTVKRVLHNIR